MSAKLVQTGVKFPDDTVQTTATLGMIYPVKLMNTDDQTTAYRHAFAIMSDGSVRGWGYNGQYNLGDGSTIDKNHAINVAFPPNFPGAKEVHTANEYMSACLDKNGQLWTWGRNDYGECGVGNTTWVRAPINVSIITGNSIYGRTISQIAMPCGIEDIGFILVLCTDGTVHACGYNAYGQCGNGNTTNQNYFVRCGTLTGVTHISSGRERYTHCTAISAGTLYTWGYNGDWQLGNNSSTSTSIPTVRNNGSLVGKTFTKAQAGYFCTYALASDGTLHGSGNQSVGQFGVGNTANQTTPIQINSNVASFQAATYEYAIITIIKNDGTAWVAGRPDYIAPYTVAVDDGYGGTIYNQENTTIWKRLMFPTAFNGTPITISKLVHGGTGSYNFIVALMSNGYMYAIGYNGNGQLGIADNQNIPVYYNNPQLVRCDVASDIGTYGHGNEGCLLILTKAGKVKVSGYGGSYSNGSLTGNTNFAPFPIQFN
jgi:alpha-tubulin suppressor-like RCC1 family protein